MPRRLMVAGNWKLHKTITESRDLAGEIAQGLARDDLDVLVAPTFVALEAVARRLEGTPVLLAAQNIFWQDQGAYTGEVSGPMIKAAGATHVIIGHSERRQYFGETETTVARRIAAARRAGLTPIVCIGETLDQREAGQTEGVLHSQLAGALAGMAPHDMDRLILAYEPVWAIGTGRTASTQQVTDVHAAIRTWLATRFNKQVANHCRILYGGSVKPANAAGLLAQAEVDGALVGGASLNAADFLAIINASGAKGAEARG